MCARLNSASRCTPIALQYGVRLRPNGVRRNAPIASCIASALWPVSQSRRSASARKAVRW